ncbi:MAG: hypothetical protein ABIK65_13300 [Candidatus Eisenbacteria bacterium]
MSSKTDRFARIIGALALAVLLAASCGGKDAGERAAEKVAEKMIARAAGGDADVDIEKGKISMKGDGFSMESEETDSWPDEIPGDVPRFSYGKIERVTRTENEEEGVRSYHLHFKDVDGNAGTRYRAELDEMGWETTMVDMGAEGGMVNGQKGEAVVMVMFSKEEKMANLVITVQ